MWNAGPPQGYVWNAGASRDMRGMLGEEGYVECLGKMDICENAESWKGGRVGGGIYVDC